MSYIIKEDDYTFLLHVKIKPNAKFQKCIDDGDYLTIFIRSKPIQNKANKELINLLKKKLKISANQVVILSGKKNLKKVVQLQFLERRDVDPIKNDLLD
ncbi:MAG: DUF167 domain-containing protein [Promethearchaeota archaeon]|jgi:uncharacterized protein (TIGR00251 family)